MRVGPQLASKPATCRSRSVPPGAGTTNSPDSLLTLEPVYRICEPSGDQLASSSAYSSPEGVVRMRACEASASATASEPAQPLQLKPVWSKRVYAIRVPSGDQAGSTSCSLAWVSRVRP